MGSSLWIGKGNQIQVIHEFTVWVHFMKRLRTAGNPLVTSPNCPYFLGTCFYCLLDFSWCGDHSFCSPNLSGSLPSGSMWNGIPSFFFSFRYELATCSGQWMRVIWKPVNNSHISTVLPFPSWIMKAQVEPPSAWALSEKERSSSVDQWGYMP